MKKFIKISLTTLGVSALVLGLACVLSAKSIDFHFANEGKIICAEHKDFGIFASGDFVCYGIVQLTQEVKVIPTPKMVNGEIDLRK